MFLYCARSTLVQSGNGEVGWTLGGGKEDNREYLESNEGESEDHILNQLVCYIK